jgi:Putative amidase domain
VRAVVTSAAAAAAIVATATSASAAPFAPATATSHTASAREALAKVNLKAAAAWAVKHVNDADPYIHFSDNCTNFVSSVLVWGGGDTMTFGHPTQPGNNTNDHYWYFIYDIRYVLWSHSWSVAHDLYVHLTDIHSRRISSPKDAQPGDVIFANWNGTSPNGISHVGIITKMSKGEPYITQNTPNQVNVPLNYWLKHGGRDVHVWIYQPNAG